MVRMCILGYQDRGTRQNVRQNVRRRPNGPNWRNPPNPPNWRMRSAVRRPWSVVRRRVTSERSAIAMRQNPPPPRIPGTRAPSAAVYLH